MTTGGAFVHAVPPIFDAEKVTPEQEADALAVLARHDALDLAEMLGLGGAS